MDVVGVGALNYDRLFRVGRIAGAGEEVGVESMATAPGGSAANTIVGLARLGMSTGFVGRVGGDDEGRFILNDLKKEGIDTSMVLMGNGSTGLIFAFVDGKGERAMYAHPGVNNDVRINDSNLSYAKKARYLHLSSFVGETSYRAQKELIRKLKGARVSFAPGMLYARRSLREVREMIAASEVLFLNEDEVEIFTGEGYRKGADEMLGLGARIVAVTLGKKGCYIATSEKCGLVKAYPTKAVDTTGAGDAFAAGFLYGRLKKKGLMECGSMGNWVASRCISAMGARAGLPREEDLRRVFKRIKQM